MNAIYECEEMCSEFVTNVTNSGKTNDFCMLTHIYALHLLSPPVSARRSEMYVKFQVTLTLMNAKHIHVSDK